MKSKGVFTEIIIPQKKFYSGEVEMLIVKTFDGQEGFMAGHSWCCKLLAEDGMAKLREVGSKNFMTAVLKGGYVDIKDHFTVYADDAKWMDVQQSRYYGQA